MKKSQNFLTVNNPYHIVRFNLEVNCPTYGRKIWFQRSFQFIYHMAFTVFILVIKYLFDEKNIKLMILIV